MKYTYMHVCNLDSDACIQSIYKYIHVSARVRRVRVSAVSITPRNACGLHVNYNRLHLHVNVVSSISIVQ